MFVGGLDVSGDNIIGNYKYLAGVIGDDQLIKSKIEQLGRGDNVHMGSIKNRQTKMKILANVNFNDAEIIAFCARIDKKDVLNSIKKSQGNKSRRQPLGLLIHRYHRAMFSYLHPKIIDFLQLHGHIMSDVKFQCDSDCLNFARSNSLKSTGPGSAHSLADIVGWGNTSNRSIGGVLELDLRWPIEVYIRRHFKR